MRQTKPPDDGGDTTLPSLGLTTAVTFRAVHARSLAWIFPVSRVSRLVDGHVFGRDAVCHTVLDDHEVSRRHAEVRGLEPVLHDLDSRNGVYVNGERVVRERALTPGDVVRIASWIGVVLPPGVEATPFESIAPGWYGGPQLGAAVAEARRAASSRLPVVVEGETGTGKEGIARALHAWSGRAGAFVAVDCGAVPEQLAESELFGHTRGAFTGALRDHPGHFVSADRGTLFLDEICNLPLSIQAKLLRVLEDGEVAPVGGQRRRKVDVRVVVGAQEPLERGVRAGRFRDDLRARLEGLTVSLPPLRARKTDVLPLFQRLLARGGREPPRLDPKLVEALLLYDWPRNVRELSMLAERLMALHGDGDVLRRSMLPPALLPAASSFASRTVEPHTRDGDGPAVAEQDASAAPKRTPTDDADQHAAILRTLAEHDQSVARAARALGISRNRIYRVLEARERAAHRKERAERS